VPGALQRVHEFTYCIAVCSTNSRTNYSTYICSHTGSNLSDDRTNRSANGITEPRADSLPDCISNIFTYADANVVPNVCKCAMVLMPLYLLRPRHPIAFPDLFD